MVWLFEWFFFFLFYEDCTFDLLFLLSLRNSLFILFHSRTDRVLLPNSFSLLCLCFTLVIFTFLFSTHSLPPSCCKPAKTFNEAMESNTGSDFLSIVEREKNEKSKLWLKLLCFSYLYCFFVCDDIVITMLFLACPMSPKELI